jgi:outer membrane protein assembly factor BamB
VLNVNPEEPRPLTLTARSDAPGEEELPRFPLLWRGQFWVADTQLAGYEIRSRIALGPITDKGSTFFQPLSCAGQTVYTVRRKPGAPGVTVSALSMAKQEVQWQTVIGVPLAGEPIVDAAGSELIAVTCRGGVFPLTAAQLQGQKVVPEPLIKSTETQQPIRNLVLLSGGMFAITAGPGTKEIFVYDPQEKRFRFLPASAPLACAPLGAMGGLLVPCADGSVSLLDPKTTAEMARPFRSNAAGASWLPGAAIGAGEVLLSDGTRKIYRLAIEGNPPAITAAGEGEAGQPVVSPLAVVGNVAYAVDKQDTLGAFELPGVTLAKQHALDGHCVWGPRCIGKLVLLATDKDRLYAFNDRQEPAWQVPLPYGPLAGAPAASGNAYYLASTRGTVWKIATDSGKEEGKVEADVPLGTGPVLMGERLFVAGHDGTLFEVKRP